MLRNLLISLFFVSVCLGVSYAQNVNYSQNLDDHAYARDVDVKSVPKSGVNTPVLERILPTKTDKPDESEKVIENKDKVDKKGSSTSKKVNKAKKQEPITSTSKKKSKIYVKNGVYYPDGVPEDNPKKKTTFVCDLPSKDDQVYPLPAEFSNLRTTYVKGIYCEKVDKYGGFTRQKHYFYDCRKKQMVLIPKVYYIHPKYMNKLKNLRSDYEKYSSKSDYFKHNGKTYKIPTYKDNKY